MKPDHDSPSYSPAYSVVDVREAPGRPVLKLLNLILSEGILSGASRIRFASGPEKCRVEFFKDSWLDAMTIPAIAARPLLNRVRVMATLGTSQGPGATAGHLRVSGSGNELSVQVTVHDQGNGVEQVLLQLLQR